MADIAARDGQVKVNGWRDGAGVALDDAVAQLSELGFKHLVYTDIARDGMQTASMWRRIAMWPRSRAFRRGFGRHLDARRHPRAGRGG